MIAYIDGVILEKEARALIVVAGGVGYRVTVLASLLGQVAAGETVQLRLYHQVSDEAESLYGFQDTKNLRMFELLLTVPSVGPRTAMNLLDIAPPDVLAQAVAGNDVKLLTRVSGVGKKTAERILVELKEKFKDIEPSRLSGEIQDDIVAALVSMGYTKSDAQRALHIVPPETATVEEAVRAVLQHKA